MSAVHAWGQAWLSTPSVVLLHALMQIDYASCGTWAHVNGAEAGPSVIAALGGSATIYCTGGGDTQGEGLNRPEGLPQSDDRASCWVAGSALRQRTSAARPAPLTPSTADVVDVRPALDDGCHIRRSSRNQAHRLPVHGATRRLEAWRASLPGRPGSADQRGPAASAGLPGAGEGPLGRLRAFIAA